MELVLRLRLADLGLEVTRAQLPCVIHGEGSERLLSRVSSNHRPVCPSCPSTLMKNFQGLDNGGIMGSWSQGRGKHFLLNSALPIIPLGLGLSPALIFALNHPGQELPDVWDLQGGGQG